MNNSDTKISNRLINILKSSQYNANPFNSKIYIFISFDTYYFIY